MGPQMRSLPVNLITPGYVTNVLFLPVRVPLALGAIRARARHPSHPLLLAVLALVAAVGAGVGRRGDDRHSRRHGRRGWLGGGGSDVLQDLPLAGVGGVLLDVLADELGGRGGRLGYYLDVAEAWETVMTLGDLEMSLETLQI